MSPDPDLAGRLLVATPVLGDPNFNHTVVIMLEHSEEGALGLVLNRPSRTEVAEALPDWQDLVGEPPVMFVGGPVEGSAVVAVGEAAGELDGVAPVRDDLGVVDLHRGRDHYLDGLHRLRLFAGYAGWGPGQAEDEVAEGAWYVLDAQADDVFTGEPRELWRTVLQRAGGKLALLANAPYN